MGKKTEHVERGLRVVEESASATLTAVQRTLTAVQREEKLIQASQVIGAVKVTRSLATVISAQSFRALIQFRDDKLYEAFDFTRFDDFLNESPHSPMSKNQFYERLNAIDREGNHAFDALNALNIPFSIRKALPGSVEVEGDTLIIGEERVPINDRRRVIATVKALVEKNQQQATKIEKGEAQNKKLKQERDEYKKRPSSSGAFDEYDTVLINALGALANLKSIAFNLPDAERLRKRDYTFERLAEMRLELEEALGVRAPANGGAYQLSDDEIDELGDSM